MTNKQKKQKKIVYVVTCRLLRMQKKAIYSSTKLQSIIIILLGIMST